MMSKEYERSRLTCQLAVDVGFGLFMLVVGASGAFACKTIWPASPALAAAGVLFVLAGHTAIELRRNRRRD